MKHRGEVTLVLLVVVFVGLIWAGKALGISPASIQQALRSFGPWAPVVYILAYGQPIVPLPAIVMTSLAGIMWGWKLGFLAAMAGATLRACSEFLVARLLGRGAVERLLKGKAAALDQQLAANGFQAVLIIRLIPSLPFDLLNYGMGFSRIGFLPYLLGTIIGMAPGGFVYVYFGGSLFDSHNWWKVVLAIALIVGLTVFQRRWSKRRSAASGAAT